MSPPPVRWLKVQRAADRLGVTSRTLSNWRRTGYGPTWKRTGSGLLYYDAASVAEWAEWHPWTHPDPADRRRALTLEAVKAQAVSSTLP